MNQNTLTNMFNLNSDNAVLPTLTHKDDQSSNLPFYNILSETPVNTSNMSLYHFKESADKLLNNNQHNNLYSVLAFDVGEFDQIINLYGNSFRYELINHIEATLKNHIKEPNLYCNVKENFIILLEYYKSIDVAMLVILLSEEISRFCAEININLNFGICFADQIDQNISFLYKRAFHAKSTIKGQCRTLLANYA